ncbi:Aste57867_8441 [Aphanomyces stellatus]|uniref:Aste57867_8441 protein n=1 Tax=Aphanomyces stellatus TaxID=120398 RepID=A0A485KKF8_9STRA|nr:hypothetical protein As57867_008409 [Aphanomyces stellatus]VFT85327.1 Aste57867_8441 [Aphanomyces stellatus]
MSGVVRTRSSSYHRVSQTDEDASSAVSVEPNVDVEIEELKKRVQGKPPTRAEWISTKLHALLWVLGAGSLVYTLDVFRVAFRDARVHRVYFNIGLVCFGINCCITLYLAVWLPYIKKIDLEWSVYCPRMVPTATAVGLLCALTFTIGLWPVWGLFTPGILFVLFLGSLMTAHFLPAI